MLNDFSRNLRRGAEIIDLYKFEYSQSLLFERKTSPSKSVCAITTPPMGIILHVPVVWPVFFFTLSLLIGICQGFLVNWRGSISISITTRNNNVPLEAVSDMNMDCSTSGGSSESFAVVDDGASRLASFDKELWEPYEEFVQNNMLNNSRVLKKDKPEDVESVVEYILTDRPVLKAPTFSGDARPREEVVQMMSDQKTAFNESIQFSRIESEFAVRCFTYLADNLAKQRNPKPMAIAWQKVKESGIILRENALSTFMYVLGLDPTFNDLLLEVATFHDWVYPPNEKTITLRIKALIQMGDARGAEDMLATLPVRIVGMNAIC